MRRKYIFIIILIMSLALQAKAQIKPVSTHFNYLNELYNPAFYGIDEQYKFALNYRNQWAKLEGAPQTFNFLSSFYLPKINSGIGLNISNDRIGALRNTTLQLGYNYIINIKQKLKIGIGAQAGFEFSNLDASKLITPDGNYNGTINNNDDILANQPVKTFRPLLNIGVSFNTKYIDAGIAYLNAIDNPSKFDGNIKNLETTYRSVLQTNFRSDVKTGENFSLQPALIINTDFINIQTDMQLIATYKSMVGFGTNIRGYNKNAFESVSIIVKVNPFKNKMIGCIYSYDFVFKQLGSVNKGTHEITLYYNMKHKNITIRQPKFINNPRFL